MLPSQGYQARLSEAFRLALVYRLARELNAELKTEDVLRRVLNATAEALGTPHASIVAIRRKTLRTVYTLGGGRVNAVPLMERVLSEGLAGFVLHNYRTVIVNDITQNPLWMPLPDEPLSPQSGSALCVPLIHSGDVVGVMTLAHPIRSYFTADAINLTNTMIEMGAAALMHTMLLEDARQIEQRYISLFDDAIVPIIITDLAGNILEINKYACEFLGYLPDEVKRRNISTIHRMGTGPIAGDRFGHLKRGVEVRFQSVVWAKDGSSRAVQVYAKRVSNSGEDYIQWIEHDLTAQVMLEQLRRDLSSMVYHDVRGPLSNMHTSLEMLKKLMAAQHDHTVQALLDVASRSEQQMQRLIDSLLDVQRLEENSRFISRTNSNLSQLIVHAIDQINLVAEEKSIRIRQALADDIPLLYIDDDMITRVIVNLLDNAIKYSPEGGVITVSTATSDSEVYMRVKDTGPGIPPEAQSAIFDKFSRVKQQHMPRGVGLGLAFCKLAVEAHGGRIWVHSDQKIGSTFTIALPIEAPATQELPFLGTEAPLTQLADIARPTVGSNSKQA